MTVFSLAGGSKRAHRYHGRQARHGQDARDREGIVAEVRALDEQAFRIPAMGSHGGGAKRDESFTYR